MPVKSKEQLKFMKAVAEGSIKKPGLTPEKAEEFVKDNPVPSQLPDRKYPKLAKMLKK